MKLTRQHLRKLIKEQVHLLLEAEDEFGRERGYGNVRNSGIRAAMARILSKLWREKSISKDDIRWAFQHIKDDEFEWNAAVLDAAGLPPFDPSKDDPDDWPPPEEWTEEQKEAANKVRRNLKLQQLDKYFDILVRDGIIEDTPKGILNWLRSEDNKKLRYLPKVPPWKIKGYEETSKYMFDPDNPAAVLFEIIYQIYHDPRRRTLTKKMDYDEFLDFLSDDVGRFHKELSPKQWDKLLQKDNLLIKLITTGVIEARDDNTIRIYADVADELLHQDWGEDGTDYDASAAWKYINTLFQGAGSPESADQAQHVVTQVQNALGQGVDPEEIVDELEQQLPTRAELGQVSGDDSTRPGLGPAGGSSSGLRQFAGQAFVDSVADQEASRLRAEPTRGSHPPPAIADEQWVTQRLHRGITLPWYQKSWGGKKLTSSDTTLQKGGWSNLSLMAAGLLVSAYLEKTKPRGEKIFGEALLREIDVSQATPDPEATVADTEVNVELTPRPDFDPPSMKTITPPEVFKILKPQFEKLQDMDENELRTYIENWINVVTDNGNSSQRQTLETVFSPEHAGMRGGPQAAQKAEKTAEKWRDWWLQQGIQAYWYTFMKNPGEAGDKPTTGFALESIMKKVVSRIINEAAQNDPEFRRNINRIITEKKNKKKSSSKKRPWQDYARETFRRMINIAASGGNKNTPPYTDAPTMGKSGPAGMPF